MRCKLLAACLILGAWVAPARAQTIPMPNYFHELVFSPQPPQPLPDTKTFHDYVVDGKLRLSLQDAMLLLLEHNTEVHINRLSVTDAEFNVVRAFANFDPSLFSSFNTDRAKSSTSSQLQGASVLSDLEQQTAFGYNQMLQTGTNINIGLSADKSSTNSIYYFLNPSIFASLNFAVTQPLLRGNGRFVNRAPILIARRNVAQSTAQFEGEVSDSLYQLLTVYWSVVQARENMKIAQKSQDLAQASYDRDKRALELGALPPLDIYRSEAEVANRKVQVIQAQYQLKSMEDQFRRLLGADQDADIRALDLDLVENPEPSGELLKVDTKEAVATALAHRPELEALRQQMAANKIVQTVATVSAVPKCRRDPALQRFQGNFADAIQQFLFPGDVIVEGCLMNIQAGGDLACGGFVKSFFAEQGRSRVEYKLRGGACRTGIAGPVRFRYSPGGCGRSGGLCVCGVPRPVNCVFHAAQRRPGVLAHEFFRAGGIARLYGIENRFVVAYRFDKIARLRRSHNRGRRGESNRLHTIKRKLDHRASRNRS